MWAKILLAVGCLVLPVLWGMVVNWLFVRWYNRERNHSAPSLDDPDVIDYQI